MEFEPLDPKCEEVLKELLNTSTLVNKNIRGTEIEYLILNNFVNGISAKTLSDSEPVYIITGITQKGKSYFDKKKEYKKEKNKSVRREWWKTIVSAIISGLIGLLPINKDNK